jgi:hypothetical protein
LMSQATFAAEFENSLAKSAVYDGSTRIVSLNLSMNSEPIDPSIATKNTNITPLVAEYLLETPFFNHSSFLIAGFPRIINYVWLNQPILKNNLTVSMILANYTNYYILYGDSGVEYNSTGCTLANSRFIDLYNPDNGLTVITSDNADLTVCKDERGIILEVGLALKNETRYDFLFHQGSYNETIKYVSNYVTEKGMPQNLTGISIEGITRINSTSYSLLKEQWNYPAAREFNLLISNSTDAILYDYSPVSPQNQNVFAKQEKIYVLDKYGNREMYKLRLLGW